MKLTFDNVWVKVNGSVDDIAHVVELLTYTVRKARHWKGRGSAKWSPKRCLLDMRRGAFPAGLLKYVTDGLRRRGIPYELVDATPYFDDVEIVEPNVALELRPDQRGAIEALLRHKRGICKVPTRGGKTVIAMAAAASLGLPALFVVHTTELLGQTVNAFSNLLYMKVGEYGGERRELRKITVATIQALYSAIKRGDKELLSWLKEREIVIFDEVHHSSRSYQRLSQALPKARYRWGLSATPLMSGKGNKLMTLAITGPIVYDLEIQDLVEDGRLARPIVYYLEMNDVIDETRWVDIYRYGIVENDERNMTIALIALEMLKKGKKSLILIEKIEHGKILLELLKDKVDVEFVWGGSPSEERTNALMELQFGDLDVLIASRIFNEGVDIPYLECVIVASGYKSVIQSYQKYGRGITKVEGKEETVIFDFIDTGNQILLNHSYDRLMLFEKDEAFEVQRIRLEDV